MPETMKTPKIKQRKNYWIVYTSRRNRCTCYTLAGVALAVKLLTCTK